MKCYQLHSWDISPQQAVKIQRDLASRVVTCDDFHPIRFIAGADIAIDTKRNIGIAGIIVYEFSSLVERERVSASVKLTMPYIPGLLAFREAPALIAAFEKISTTPDLILFDGQGLAHPRRLGIASHMGLLLDCPTIGCAKSRLIGVHDEPGQEVGSTSPLRDKGEIIGTVIRTRKKVKPIYVSVGHKISLNSAQKVVMQCLDGFRIPKPTREADRYVARLKK